MNYGKNNVQDYYEPSASEGQMQEGYEVFWREKRENSKKMGQKGQKATEGA